MSGSGKLIIYKTIPPAGIETIEKKGLGHPDALCDALAERVSAAYSRYCFENFGVLIPYSIDGLTMDEGETNVEFGGGVMVKPIRLYLRGSFAAQFMGKKIPYMDIAKKAIYEYLDMIVPRLEARRWVRVIDGTQAYGGPRETFAINRLAANHMYTVTAYYPPTVAESCALRIEQKLNAPIYKEQHPYIGSDNRVTVVRNGNSIDILAYVSMISECVPDNDTLRTYVEAVEKDIEAVAASDRIMVNKIDIYVSDNPLHDGRALTVTGSSIESYNGGAVGRSRYPVYHAAKIYSVVAYQISKRIFNEEKVAASVTLISKIGAPLNSPWHINVNIISDKNPNTISQPMFARAEEIVNDELGHIEEFVKTLMYGKN